MICCLSDYNPKRVRNMETVYVIQINQERGTTASKLVRWWETQVDQLRLPDSVSVSLMAAEVWGSLEIVVDLS